MSLQGLLLLFAGALILPSISFGEKTSLKSLSHPLGRYRLRVLQDGTVMEAASCMVTRSASQWLGEGSKALPGANGAEAGAVRGVGRHPAGWEHIGLKAWLGAAGLALGHVLPADFWGKGDSVGRAEINYLLAELRRQSKLWVADGWLISRCLFSCGLFALL